ncbi:MAG: D-sedoheptulose-7-phosphate isomerase [Bacteriovoracaceae bacterium]
MEDYLSRAFSEAHHVLGSFLSQKENLKNVENFVSILVQSYQEQGRIFSAGNGGSLCDSMHFAEELTGRFRKNRSPLAAMSINDPSHITCVANDFGYDEIFSRYIEAWANKGDVFLAISTSGNSTNIIKAVEVAKSKGVTTLGLLGKGGGQLKDLCNHSIVIDSKSTDRIQEMHIKIIHCLIEGIERQLFPENYKPLELTN